MYKVLIQLDSFADKNTHHHHHHPAHPISSVSSFTEIGSSCLIG